MLIFVVTNDSKKKENGLFTTLHLEVDKNLIPFSEPSSKKFKNIKMDIVPTHHKHMILK